MMNYYGYFLFSTLILLSGCGTETNKITGEYYPVKQSPSAILTESGELESVNSEILSVPGRWEFSYQIVKMPDEGTRVSEGDTVVWFDTKEIESRVDEALKQLEKLTEQMRERHLQNEQTILVKENTIKTLEIQMQIALNQLEQSRYNSENDQQTADLEVKKTELSLVNAREDLEATKILNRNSEQEIQIQINQVKTNLDQTRTMLNEMFLTAPKDGMIIYYKDRHRSDKVKVGDTVQPRQAVVSIPDFNKMMAIIKLNEVDHPKVKTGQAANIIVEAYPDTVFSGTISFVSEIVSFDYSQSYNKSYEVHVVINSLENHRLKPGLSARAEITMETYQDRYEIPAWCLLGTEGYFHVITSDKKQIQVDLDLLNAGIAVVNGPLKPGMMLVPNIAIPKF